LNSGGPESGSTLTPDLLPDFAGRLRTEAAALHFLFQVTSELSQVLNLRISPEQAALSIVDEDEAWRIIAKGIDTPSLLHNVSSSMKLSR
jgi:hypothetical protein